MYVVYCEDEFGFNCIIGIFSTGALAHKAIDTCKEGDKEFNGEYTYYSERFDIDSFKDL